MPNLRSGIANYSLYSCSHWSLPHVWPSRKSLFTKAWPKKIIEKPTQRWRCANRIYLCRVEANNFTLSVRLVCENLRHVHARLDGHLTKTKQMTIKRLTVNCLEREKKPFNKRRVTADKNYKSNQNGHQYCINNWWTAVQKLHVSKNYTYTACFIQGIWMLSEQ